MYVVRVGFRMVVGYGDRGDPSYPLLESEIETTDRDLGTPAVVDLGIERPLVYPSAEAAQRLIDRFQIPNARPWPWDR